MNCLLCDSLCQGDNDILFCPQIDFCVDKKQYHYMKFGSDYLSEFLINKFPYRISVFSKYTIIYIFNESDFIRNVKIGTHIVHEAYYDPLMTINVVSDEITRVFERNKLLNKSIESQIEAWKAFC